MSKAAAAAIPAVAGAVGSALSASSSPTSQTASTYQTLPDWVNGVSQSVLQQGLGVTQNMLGPYSGPTVAGLTNGAQADIAGLQSQVGSTQPAFNLSQGVLAQLANGFAMPQVNPGSIATTDLSSYMNPYTSDVINTSLDALNDQRKQALNQIGDQAIKAGAFGGSRQGVAEGVTNAETAKQAGSLAAQLQQQNFLNAEQMAGQDIGTNLTGQTANQTAALNAANLRANAAGNLATVANTGQSANIQSLLAALQGQGILQSQNQNELNADQAAYSAAQQFPVTQLSLISALLGKTPYGTSTTSTQSLPPSSPIAAGIGGGLSGLGIGASLFGKGGAFAS